MKAYVWHCDLVVRHNNNLCFNQGLSSASTSGGVLPAGGQSRHFESPRSISIVFRKVHLNGWKCSF